MTREWADCVTHVLIERDDVLDVSWVATLQTGPMVRWLAEQPDLKEIQIPTPRMRLFTTMRTPN